MAEVRVQEGEPLENALRRFKRKVQQEDIIKEVKRHSYYLKPGEKKRVKEALERVNMAHRMRHYPAQLSGGQQQRVAVARALAGSPSILLADEPTGNLDSKNGEAVMHLLSDLHREGSTICMVTHDPRFAKHAQREVHLFDGKVVSEQELKKLEEEVEA